MARDIDSRSRNILNFRPVIDFIEPDVEAATPNPIPLPKPVIDDLAVAEKTRLELFNIATSVDVLATALQARIDLKAKDMVVRLDPLVDDAVIAAVNRAYPDADETGITYDIYKQCRENIRLYADAQADKNNISEEQIAAASKVPNGIVSLFESPAVKDGTLRPELSHKARLIEPIDMKKFQVSLLKILANVLWQLFIVKAFDVSVAGIGIKSLLPDEIAKLNKTERKVIAQLKKAGIPLPS